MVSVSDRSRQRRGAPASTGGQFLAEAKEESLGGLDSTSDINFREALMAQEPDEIDAQLAGILNDVYRAQDLYESAVRSWQSMKKGNAARKEGDLSYSSWTDERESECLATATTAGERVAAEEDRMVPFEDEFDRRGGWTRAFMTTGSDPHVHSSRDCQSCYPTTRYAWLPEYSGHDENEIVDDAGMTACTYCYPSAPVDVLKRPSKIELPEKKAARHEKERKALEREAKRVATGIWNPDGTELREATEPGSRWSGHVIKTERTAEIEAVDELAGRLWDAHWKAQDPNTTIGHHNNSPYWEAKRLTTDRIVTALAVKRGQTEEETLAALEAKAQKKFAKDSRR